MNNDKKTVVVGMSGGVDSSVAALLLLEQGFDVIGLFMHNWEEEENGVCTSAQDWQDVQAVCGKLKIPHYSVNFSSEYMENVFKHFIAEYDAGRTPNPDVLCNREIKFGAFYEYAKKLGADYLATGHYADISFENGSVQLLKPADSHKDQTYFLNQVQTDQLRNVIFPLSSLLKAEVRKIADKYGLVTARKKDSTGICFIGERKFREFLSGYLPNKSGDIEDTHGKVVGRHLGLMYYTYGQRKGLGIGGVKDELQNRWYVTEKDLKRNVLTVSCGEGEELLSNSLVTGQMNFIGENPVKSGEEFVCNAKFRYRQSEQKVRVRMEENTALIDFFSPQRAVTPGQYAVLYDDNRCLGGGVIDKVQK